MAPSSRKRSFRFHCLETRKSNDDSALSLRTVLRFTMVPFGSSTEWLEPSMEAGWAECALKRGDNSMPQGA